MITLLSRILGLVRESAFAYFIGAGSLMDSWVIAFKIPNLSRRIFGEGAASSSLIPVYNDQLARDRSSADRLANTALTTVFSILTIVVILGQIGIWVYYYMAADLPETRRMLELTSIMLPYMVMICLVALMAGLLQSHGHFAAPAAAPLILNVFMIGSLVIAGGVLNFSPQKQVFLVAIGVIIAGVVQLGTQLPFLAQKGVYLSPCLDFSNPAFRRMMLLMGPMILGLTVTQINTLADDFIAKWLSGSDQKGMTFLFAGREVVYPVWEGAVSYLHFSQRLYQFPLGVLGISLATAIFPVMSQAAARKDYTELTATINRGLRCGMYIALPAIIGMILVREPLVRVIFERGRFTEIDSQNTARTLFFYSLGLWGFFSQQIVTRAFYSIQESRIPALSAVFAVFLNIALNLLLIWPMKTAGLAVSTAICSYVQVIVLSMVLAKRYGLLLFDRLIWDFVKVLAACAALTGAGLLAQSLLSGVGSGFWQDMVRLAVMVGTCSGTYYLASLILRIEMLDLVVSRFRK